MVWFSTNLLVEFFVGFWVLSNGTWKLLSATLNMTQSLTIWWRSSLLWMSCHKALEKAYIYPYKYTDYTKDNLCRLQTGRIAWSRHTWKTGPIVLNVRSVNNVKTSNFDDDLANHYLCNNIVITLLLLFFSKLSLNDIK